MQLQGELGSQRAYTGVVDAVRTMVRREGPKALFAGLSPALLRQATYGSMRYGLYTPIKTALGIPPDTPKAEIPLGMKIVAGALAGAVSSAICNPADLIKVRMQAAGMTQGPVPTEYRTLFRALPHIVRTEGFRPFFKGFLTTVLRAFPVNAATFVAYETVMERFER